MSASISAAAGPASRSRLAVFYLGCLSVAGSYGLTLLLPAFVTAAGGSPARAGLIYWSGALGAGPALILSGRLAQRLGAGWSAAGGAVLYAMATGILAGGGVLGGDAYAAGLLLGAGWALFFTSAPITVSAMAGARQANGCFLILAGFNALGMGAAPIAGQLLVQHGWSCRSVFALAALLSACSAALLYGSAQDLRPLAVAAQARGGTSGLTGPARLVLASRARPFLLMVLLGACVFTTMTAFQPALASGRIQSAPVFYAFYTLGVIVPRFTVTRLLARSRPAVTTTALLAGMCLSLGGFMLAGHSRVVYAVSAAGLGVSYGLVYPLIQARAADSAPGELRHWTLWYFSLAYFVGLYGFPLIASLVIALVGSQVLLAVLLTISVVELAVSVRTQDPARPKRAPSLPARATVIARQAKLAARALMPNSDPSPNAALIQAAVVREFSYLELHTRDDSIEGHAYRRYRKGHYLPGLSNGAIGALADRDPADAPSAGPQPPAPCWPGRTAI
jgi:Major Facilitator Superfamily